MQSAKPESPPWENFDRKGREVPKKEIGDSDEESSDGGDDIDEDLTEKARVRC